MLDSDISTSDHSPSARSLAELGADPGCGCLSSVCLLGDFSFSFSLSLSCSLPWSFVGDCDCPLSCELASASRGEVEGEVDEGASVKKQGGGRDDRRKSKLSKRTNIARKTTGQEERDVCLCAQELVFTGEGWKKKATRRRQKESVERVATKERKRVMDAQRAALSALKSQQSE